MLRIAMITPGYLPVPAVNGGAVEVLIEYLLQGNEKEKKCFIDCYTVPNDKLKEYKFEKTSIIQLNIKKTTQILNKFVNILYKTFKVKKWRTSFSRELIKEMKGKKYDYVVVHNNLMAYRDIYEKTENKDNLVYVLHNNINEDDVNHVLIAQLIGKTAKKVLAVSDYTRKQFNRISKVGSAEVFYNCVDVDEYNLDISKEEIQESRTKLGVKQDDFVFMFSGRIDVYKGILELVRAFKKIDNEKVKLLVVGKSWFDSKKTEDEYTNALLKESQDISEKVIFTGFVNPKDMPKMYKVADCLVVPSIWEEPFGVVALEGMASELPLIVTNSGGLPEVVDDKCAVIVNKDTDIVDNLYRAMEYVLVNEEIRETGKTGRIRVLETPEFQKNNYFKTFCEKVGI